MNPFKVSFWHISIGCFTPFSVWDNYLVNHVFFLIPEALLRLPETVVNRTIDKEYLFLKTNVQPI